MAGLPFFEATLRAADRRLRGAMLQSARVARSIGHRLPVQDTEEQR